jgi:hypothetical protein
VKSMGGCNNELCKTNCERSNMICKACLMDTLSSIGKEDLMEVYTFIYESVRFNPKYRSQMEKMMGNEAMIEIDKFTDLWFDFCNNLLKSMKEG